MNELDRLESERLVVAHRARDEWEANIMVGYLRDCGVEAMCRPNATRSKSAARAGYYEPDTGCDVLVLEHNVDKARECMAAFQEAVTDDKMLDEEAARRLRLDRESIGRLRLAVREEQATFRFLGWLVVAFFVSAALLWALLPKWVTAGVPFGIMRWVTVGMLILAALLTGRLVGKMMQS
jgi:hypothetical protein